MTQASNKKFIIIAGPNGAGKTTFVENIFDEFLCENRFINADYFAKEISPLNVNKAAIQAGKKFLRKIDDLIFKEKSFIIETTLSGRTLLRKIKMAQRNGFEIHLIFLWISSVELCDFRVKARVALGGHNIPFTDIRRRYHRGLINLEIYRKLVDSCEVYNADSLSSLVIIESKNEPLMIHNQDLFNQILFSIKEANLFINNHNPLK